MTTPRARYARSHRSRLSAVTATGASQALRALVNADLIDRHRWLFKGLGTDDWRVAHPADDIVFQPLGAAYPLNVKLYRHQNFALTKGQMLAEHADFLKSLQTTQMKLRTLSPELDRLLGNHADPLGIADLMDDLIGRLRRERAPRLARASVQHPALTVSGPILRVDGVPRGVLSVADSRTIPDAARQPGAISGARS